MTRPSWRLPGLLGDLVIVRREAARPADAKSKLDAWLAEPAAREALLEMCGLSGSAARARLAHASPEELKRTLRPELERALRSGKLLLVPRPPAGLRATPSSAAAESEPPSEAGVAEEKTWVAFQVLDSETAAVVTGLKLRITLPNGEERSATTDGNGEVRFEGVEPGECAVACDLDDPKLAETVDYVGQGRPAPKAQPGAGSTSSGPPEPISASLIARVESHKVRKGESIDGLARGAGLTWQELAKFNWGTDVPDEINEHLRDDVGCSKTTASGKNMVFDDSDVPGIVYIPRPWSRSGFRTDETNVIQVRLPRAPVLLEFLLESETTGHHLPLHPFRVLDAGEQEVASGLTNDLALGRVLVPGPGEYLVVPGRKGAFTVSGSVYYRDSETPLASETIEARPWQEEPRTLTTGANGEIALSDVPAGELVLAFQGAEYAIQVERDVSDGFFFIPVLETLDERAEEIVDVADTFWRGPALGIPYLFDAHMFKVGMKMCFGDEIPADAIEDMRNDLLQERFEGPTYSFSKALGPDTGGFYAARSVTLSDPLVREARDDPEKRFLLFIAMVHEFGHHLDFLLRNWYSDVGGDQRGEEGTRFAADFLHFNHCLDEDFEFATFHFGKLDDGDPEIVESVAYAVSAGEIDREKRARFLLSVATQEADRGEVLIDGKKVTVEFFKIRGQGAVHEEITKSAAAMAGAPYDERLDEGCAWPDVPCGDANSVETCYGKMMTTYKKSGTLPNRSHFGDLQFWHSMAPTGDWTNEAVLDKIVRQAKEWYALAIEQDQLFHIGKILHMVQDSYSHSHVVRVERDEPATEAESEPFDRPVKAGEGLVSIGDECGMTWQELARFNWGTDVPTEINSFLYHEVGCRKPRADDAPFDAYANYHFSDNDWKFGSGTIRVPGTPLGDRKKNQVVYFQSYVDQDEHRHAEADKIASGDWKTVPGALDARDASAVVLKMFLERRSPAALEKYLRETVYPFAPGAANAKAGGSAPGFAR